MDKKNTAKIKKIKHHLPMFDIPFFVGVMLLLCIGLIMLFSAGYADAFNKHNGDSYYYIRKQLIFAIIGVAIMIVLSFINTNLYRRFSKLYYFVCIFLLILVLIVSKDSEKRWLYIAGFQFQPSEFAKIGVVIFMADYIARHRDKMQSAIKGFLIPALIFVVPTVLIGVETHLSGAILVMAIGTIMLIAGGCRMRYIILVGSLGVAGGATLIFFTDYMQKRIQTYLNPESDLLGDGWQIYQSLTTIGSGGLFGLGYGKSRQKYLYMSEPQNDFIFSIVCEELGLIGAVFILALFAFLIWRGIHIARNAPDMFTSLVVVGIISRIAVQVIFNIAVVTNTVPVTGVPLPFFSYGGTALVVLLAEMGIVLRISRYSSVEKGT